MLHDKRHHKLHCNTPGRKQARALLVRIASVIATAVIATAFATPSFAQVTDPHALYEQRCAACHQPHARDLVKETLTVREGRVVLKSSGAPLADFLNRHPRGLSPGDAQTLMTQFEAMLQTGFLFQEKCIVCHERASELARLRLIERNGALMGRYTNRDIAAFMPHHGRLTSPEVETIMAMLHRQVQATAPH